MSSIWTPARLAACLAVALFPLTASPAQAIPIAAGSQIDISGGLVPVGAANVNAATGLDFLDRGMSGTPIGTISLTNTPTGSFASVFTTAACPLAATAGGCGVIQDIPSFASFSPVTGFYTITEGSSTLFFDLSTLIVQSRVAGSTTSLPALTVSGTGVFRLDGFDPTEAIFSLTTQGPGTVSFSASTVASETQVPEPASFALLGSCVLALGIARLRRAGRRSAWLR